MKQTVEEAAKECRIVNIKAGLDYPYDEIDMRMLSRLVPNGRQSNSHG